MPIKIFLDTSDINEIRALKDNPLIQGYTTNPTLMRKAGVTDYEKFCKEVLAEIGDKPVSFEVFADDFDEMERQARIISSWGKNVYVKIPIMTTGGSYTNNLVEKLIKDKINVNLTAVMGVQGKEHDGVKVFRSSFFEGWPWNGKAILSIFAGRIADTGRNPRDHFVVAKEYFLNTEILWASPREVLNIYQAEEAGADIITVTPELFRKYEKMKDYDLSDLSLDTVKMFYDDAQASGFKL